MKTKNWLAQKTEKEQGIDFREVIVDGKVSVLKFTIKPKSIYWRAGFKLYDPNNRLLPLRSTNSFLFHLGSTLTEDDYGLTAYLNGDWVKELNKTLKYPRDRVLRIKLVINHNNFIEVYINDSLEFKPNWHLQNSSIRQKVALFAWGDAYDYKVEFRDIVALNWKSALNEKNNNSKQTKKLMSVMLNAIENFLDNLTNPQKFLGALFVGLLLLYAAQIINTKSSKDDNSHEPKPTQIIELPVEELTPTDKITASVEPFVIIEEGKSFTDTKSGIIIGANWILYRSYSDLTITFPGKESQEFKDIKSGRVFAYTGKDGIEYNLIIVEIDYKKIKVKIQS